VVVASLSIGSLVGVLLSAGFVWVEIGRYATPQVPETLFDERREIFAYTAGLFVGVPLAICYILYQYSLGNGALPGALLFLALLVIGAELAQWSLLRSRYWGRDESGPFYALGFRSAVGGLLALAIVSQYLAGPTLTWEGVLLALLESAAVLGLQVAAALLSMRPRPGSDRPRGGPISGGLFAVFGFFLLGIGPVGGELSAFLATGITVLGALLVYRRLRTVLATIPAPSAGVPLESRPAGEAYGRTSKGRP
jgi:hypothetical protein